MEEGVIALIVVNWVMTMSKVERRPALRFPHCRVIEAVTHVALLTTLGCISNTCAAPSHVGRMWGRQTVSLLALAARASERVRSAALYPARVRRGARSAGR